MRDTNILQGKPFRPYEQLMGVMPARSNHTIPKAFHPLMENADSDIIDFYPEDFDLDLNGKKFAWQGVALLPFIDEKRLLDAMATRYPLLTDDERSRNEVGKDALLFSAKHPLYDEATTNFYSKKAKSSKFALDARVSEGLTGKVEKNESYLPSSSLVFPLPGETPFDEIDDDQSLTVHYSMPSSTHNHKSMLLPGLNMPAPVLDYSDIEQTRQRSQKTGRGHGGVPFDNGGRGGRFNYGNDNRNGGRNGGYDGGYGRGGGGGGGRGGYDNRGGRGSYDNQGGRGNYDNHGGRGSYDNQGGYGRPPPPQGGQYGMLPANFGTLPPHLAAQAAQHFGANGIALPPPPPPPGWLPQQQASDRQGGYNNGGGYNGNGYNGNGNNGGQGGGYQGGGRGGGGYGRY